MTQLVEGTHAGRYILSEANFHRSRDKAMLKTGLNLKAGAVLGRLALASEPAPFATPGPANVGNGVFGTITKAAGTKPGAFRLTMTTGGATAAFSVTDPDGVALAAGAVGTAYAQGGLGFTLADGAVDFAIGDYFDITVNSGTGAYDTYATAGATNGVGILYEDTDTTGGAKQVTVHVRDCELLGKELVWDPAITPAQLTTGYADLAAKGMIVRP